MSTLGELLTANLRSTTQAFAAGDQVAPCAVLWTDPERLWEGVLPDLQSMLPEIFALGSYSPAKRMGPALWLRCIEAGVVEGGPPAGVTPVFYLPGVSRETLVAAEDCPPELAALVELQYRGVMWLHPSGKDWTPLGYLNSKHGGLGLEVARDSATLEALAGALPKLMQEPISQLQGRRLDADFFHGLVAPDATGLMLRWLSDPEVFRQRRTASEWKAFCEQSKSEFQVDPAKDGPLRVALFLAGRGGQWKKAWLRFAEAPANYAGVVEWLRRAAPKDPMVFDSSEVWPGLNEREEQELHQALEPVAELPHDAAIQRVLELERKNGDRRTYVWQKLGLSPLATALEPLARLAGLCRDIPGAPSAEAYAEAYAKNGWKVDAAALATMAACGSPEQHGVVLGALRAVYLPWLEGTSRHLQHLMREAGNSIAKRAKLVEASPGRLLLFADGLRMDVAQMLATKLATAGMDSKQEWDWSTIPSVTATAKPAASPISSAVKGGETNEEFRPILISTGQLLTQDRFVAALEGKGWQRLGPGETGDPSGSAWTEAGALDKRGHTEGWKLARSVETELLDLVSRISALLHAGWAEVRVVTDHGWLLLPWGLPKVELKSFLAESRWGRCAALKAAGQADTQMFPWHWNPSISIASPPGVGCFRASMEYSHGGVSLQEMVTPVLRVQSAKPAPGSARISSVKWSGAKCKVTVDGDWAGCRVDIRTRQADEGSSLLTDQQAREISPEGKATVFLEDDSDIGKIAHIVLLDASKQVIDSQSTALGN